MSDEVVWSDRQLPSEPHLREIGRVIAQWAYLEFDLHNAFRRLLGARHENSAQIVSTTLWNARTLNQTMQLICAEALDGVGGERTVHFQELLKNIEDLRDKRDRVAHSIWWQPDRPGAHPDREKLLRRKSATQIERGITVESMKELADSIEWAMTRLNLWIVNYKP